MFGASAESIPDRLLGENKKRNFGIQAKRQIKREKDYENETTTQRIMTCPPFLVQR